MKIQLWTRSFLEEMRYGSWKGDANNASAIYSLDRFKERYDKKLIKAYLEGRYGVIPMFKQFSFREEE